MKWVEVQTQKTAAELFEPLAQEPHSFFLDSSSEGRYSFLGAFPYKVVTSLKDIESELDHCKDIKNNLPSSLSHIPFLGGAVGFISYEAIRQWENHLRPAKPEPFHMPDILFCFYDTFFVVDHFQKKIFLISLELTPQSREIFAIFKDRVCSSDPHQISLREICAQRSPSLSQPFGLRTMPARAARWSSEHTLSLNIASNLSFEEYCEKIEKAKYYIRHGEIYQVNLSQCLQAPLTTSPYEAYKKLRVLNPAPFSAYLNFGEGQILCSSPERFLKMTSEGLIQTEPIKGTVKRGKLPQEDEKLKEFLLTSEKNRAELMMIVDLERNDLGKICQFGSIEVPTLYELRTYATVHHLVSVIQGHLKTKNLTEIIQASFPGGSITGAPKLRAMQIIDELEPHNRGIYTGSIGYIDYRRQMDLNIAIRTIMHQKGNAFFPLGGGIVWDSNPTEEYEETLYKGQALISAVSK